MNPVLFGHLFRQLLRPGRLIGLSLLAAIPGIIIAIVGAAGEIDAGNAADIVATIGATTFPIAALILAGSTLRDERDDGTLPHIYLNPVSRGVMAATSIGAAFAATALLGLVAAAAVTVAAVVVGFDPLIGLAAVPMYLAAAAGYSALFVPLGYLVPRVILAGLGYVIVWEQIVARLVTGVANTSVWRFGLSVFYDLIEGGEEMEVALGPVRPGTGGAVAKVVVVMVIGWLLLTWALRRRDAL